MNNYFQTTHDLFELQKFAIKLGLHNISTLSAYFNNPHLSFPSIHIAGTNGKGSTAFYLSKMLQVCGLKVGLFTSPHLVDFRERIRINDALISKEYIVDFWKEVKIKVLNLKSTFFDTTTLLAFKYFSDNKVDIAIFETGLGGRLDSTNILNSKYIILTPVSFDHQKQLGNNLSSIAAEKAGIIKPKSKIFSSRQKPKVLNVFKLQSQLSDFIYLPNHVSIKIKNIDMDGLKFSLRDKKTREIQSFELPTIASYQIDNLSLAYAVAKEYCKDNYLKFPIQEIKEVLSKSIWPGRLQLIQKNPYIFFDVSHNVSGIKKTINVLSTLTNIQKIDLLLGIVNDKDAIGIIKFLSGKFRTIIITEPETIRKKDGKVLLKMFRNQGQKAEYIKDLSFAYEFSRNNLTKNDILLALGSHYLIGALMRIG